MELDPMEVVDKAKGEASEAEKDKSRLNAWVAVTIALLATFMGICKVKDDNICQAMQQAQADRVDNWGYYQAKNTQEKMYEIAITQLRLQAAAATGEAKKSFDSQIAAMSGLAAHEKETKEKVKKDAEGNAEDYKTLNYRDDQFDLSDAALAVAIAMLALTSLTNKSWLFFVALLPTFAGILMGLAGLLGWHIHPDAISNLLS